MSVTHKKQPMFMFGDEEDENIISSLQPLPNNAVERSAFTATEFNPDSFLTSRRHLGLERMKAELNSHMKLLKTELIELLNNDYQDFINLSTNLKGIDKEIEELTLPLSHMEEDVKAVRGQLVGVIDSLETHLKHRTQLREKKNVLKLLLNINDSVTKVEDLLMINSDSLKNTQNEEYIEDSLGKQLERVAIEYNQMQHLLGRGKGLSFVVDNEWRIRRIDDVFHQKLSNSLSSTLSQLCLGGITRSTRKSLTEYLRIYALIDQTHIAEDIICKEFVKPAMDRIITPFSMDGKRDSVDEDTKHPLTAMYNKILSFAHTDLQPILDITQKLLKGTNYEVLVNCLWIECIDKINKECRSIFALGQTDIFHKNYSATIIFINEIEKLCYSRRSVLYLRNHPSYSEFMKRWQLLVYFQLRFREIVAPVEEILNNRTESIAIKDDISQDPKELILPGSQTIYRAIKQCWSDNVYVYGLCHRLWNLTLQLMKRYHGWIISIKSDKKLGQDKKVTEAMNKDIELFTHTTKSLLKEVILPKLPLNMQESSSLMDTVTHLLSTLENEAQ